MSNSVLPSGEELNITPDEILRYAGVDALRQIFRQERLRWNLKPNKDADYFSKTTLFKYGADLHNEGLYQRMEIRTFPDHEANAGYAGINIDNGEFGPVHHVEKWDHAVPEENWKTIAGRMQIGVSARIPGVEGNGIEDGRLNRRTINRQVEILFDPVSARAYLLSGDDVQYVNNLERENPFPLRALARIADIPKTISDLSNDLDFVADPNYTHTANNFTNSNRFVLDNIDDRTFITPEIARDVHGNFIENIRIGLNGEPGYGEGDGFHRFNSQPDIAEISSNISDRRDERINSIGHNHRFSGVAHQPGFFPGVFRSIEELERVDLIDQTRTAKTHIETPGGRRSHNYYIFDGIWSHDVFARHMYDDSYLAQSMHPSNMEIRLPGREPTSFRAAAQPADPPVLYQWRYNRVSVVYDSDHIEIFIVNPGLKYQVHDILRWTFGNEVIQARVLQVGTNGQIQRIEYLHARPNRVFEQDPSTHGVGIPFVNFTGSGEGALLSVFCRATITSHATQIKNNLYAFVDVVPTVRSDNTTPWSDVSRPDSQDGRIHIRSSAPFPSHSGINSGRGGPAPHQSIGGVLFHEHGGNATAGAHVHLFRYVINTQNPTWVIRDGIQVFTGRWVDQGPMGVSRPSDIKALLFSNADTNNFNNYYKFALDSLLDSIERDININHENSTTPLNLHIASRDPEPDQRFTIERYNGETFQIETVDITEKVLYINGATGVGFMFNSIHRNDPSFGYGNRAPGWFALSGFVSR